MSGTSSDSEPLVCRWGSGPDASAELQAWDHHERQKALGLVPTRWQFVRALMFDLVIVAIFGSASLYCFLNAQFVGGIASAVPAFFMVYVGVNAARYERNPVPTEAERFRQGIEAGVYEPVEGEWIATIDSKRATWQCPDQGVELAYDSRTITDVVVYKGRVVLRAGLYFRGSIPIAVIGDDPVDRVWRALGRTPSETSAHKNA